MPLANWLNRMALTITLFMLANSPAWSSLAF